MKIKWLDTAREDLLAIYGWYVRENPTAAAKLCRGILKSVDALADQPRLGHAEPLLEGLDYEFRSFLSASRIHRIIYFIDGDAVFIFRIWDCRQNPGKLRKSALTK